MVMLVAFGMGNVSKISETVFSTDVKGDGANDDAPSIQALLDSGDGEIYLPKPEKCCNAELIPVHQRCEFRENPSGIDAMNPRLSWWLESTCPGKRGQKQTAYQILVATCRELLDKDAGDLWDSGKVVSDQTALVEYAGRQLGARMTCHWKIRAWNQDDRPSAWSASAYWTMGLLKPEDWTAQWIANANDPVADTDSGTHIFRKTFELPGKPIRATAYVSSTGFHELHLNGRKVGQDVLSPLVSPMDRYVYYLTHDVSSMLEKGGNCLGIWLGSGWKSRFFPTEEPHVIAQLEVECEDGSGVVVVTDGTWSTRPGHIRRIGRWTYQDYGGERFDCGGEILGWSLAGFDAAGWSATHVSSARGTVLRSQMIPPNAVLNEVSARKITEEVDRTWLVDMGEMVTGWFAIAQARGTPGKSVFLDYWEWPEADLARHPAWNQRDIIEPDTAGSVWFCNKFNWHTFRYVRIIGLTAAPRLEDIKAQNIGMAMTPAYSFISSNDLVNRIHQASLNTLLANSIGGYIADCPERERGAYVTYVFTHTPFMLLHFAEGALFLEKALHEYVESQRADGLSPTTSPVAPAPSGGAGSWIHHNGGTVYALTPWHLYLYTGDTRTMTATRASAEKYLLCIESLCDKDTGLLGMRNFSGYNYLGEWFALTPFDPPINPAQSDLPRTIYNNSLYILNLDYMGRCLEISGDQSDARRYRAKANAQRCLFHAAYYRKDAANYGADHSTSLALPLLSNVPPEAAAAAVFRALEHNIRVSSKGHPTAGDGGINFVLWLLTAHNRPDLVYQIVNRSDTPSWGAMLQDGGSTIWETWGTPHASIDQVGSADTADRSRSHTGFGVVGEWFINGLAGIQSDQDQPGFKRTVIRPFIPDDMHNLSASYDSVRGKIAVAWEKKQDVLNLQVTIPPNMTATIYVPSDSLETVMECERPLKDVPQINVLKHEKSCTVLEIESGHYLFTSKFGKINQKDMK